MTAVDMWFLSLSLTEGKSMKQLSDVKQMLTIIGVAAYIIRETVSQTFEEGIRAGNKGR